MRIRGNPWQKKQNNSFSLYAPVKKNRADILKKRIDEGNKRLQDIHEKLKEKEKEKGKGEKGGEIEINEIKQLISTFQSSFDEENDRWLREVDETYGNLESRIDKGRSRLRLLCEKGEEMAEKNEKGMGTSPVATDTPQMDEIKQMIWGFQNAIDEENERWTQGVEKR